MWIEVFGLSCLLSVLEAQQLPTKPTVNPECGGMRAATKNLKAGILMLLKEPSDCQPNPHCTGVKCTWSDGGYLEIDLHHCSEPVNYHVYLNAPGKHISKNITLKEGDEKELYQKFKIHVTELSRKGNIVTTTVKLETCWVPSRCTPVYTLLDQKFCVRMQNCPGFNASATHYKPCGYKPTAEPMPEGHSTGYPPTGSIGARKGKHPKDDSKKLSTAAIIGICAASVFAILIVLAAGVYWKKYHHRSRLRAAYYNDISMHDPLYEDFGPEVA
ncbi:uncharacterized protein LOC110044984 isoform X3 [Orbicella faveolata]|uniref:uncharacterized protein LOC110044984 isoform X3 n=1 Tax=Orbicella faveolata TaxID=48498 RepID=UPI0009E62319|nr:uncharacterized protein LOC110044984 isoform X3 [Orbicella faveolata]